MSETKIKVPEGMLKAAMNAIQPSVLVGTQSIALEAALLWQREKLDSMAQSDPYAGDQYMRSESLNENAVRSGFNKALNEIRRMYDAPEVTVPAEISDLLQELPRDGSLADPWKRLPADVTNERIVEAFRRGHNSLHESHRWNLVNEPDGSIKICKGGHDKNSGCDYVRYVPKESD